MSDNLASRLGARLPDAGLSNVPLAGVQPRWATIMVEASAVLFLLAVLYKIELLGIGALLCLAAGGFALPRAWIRLPNKFLLVFATGYLFMATATAAMFDLQLGLFRLVQFILLTGAAYGFANYLALASDADRYRLVKMLAMLLCAVLLHVIAYHVAIGRLTPLKYLSDTKAIFSFGLIALFALEDRLRPSIGTVMWFAVLAAAGFIILVSGERKAYALFGILFLLSRSSITEKLLVFVPVAAALATYAAVDSESYVARQLQSLFQEEREMHISEFYLIPSIGDYSNIIRDFVNRMATELFHQHPWLGLGAGGYWHWSSNNLIGPGYPIGLAMNVHGEINRIPVESGIVGIAVAVALVASLVVKTLETQLRPVRQDQALSGRLPVYFLTFIAIYASVEALDTLMLSVIVGFSYCLALSGRPQSFSNALPPARRY